MDPYHLGCPPLTMAWGNTCCCDLLREAASVPENGKTVITVLEAFETLREPTDSVSLEQRFS